MTFLTTFAAMFAVLISTFSIIGIVIYSGWRIADFVTDKTGNYINGAAALSIWFMLWLSVIVSAAMVASSS